MGLFKLVAALSCMLLLSVSARAADPLPSEEEVPWVHGIAMHGDLKYGAEFRHFDYANPEAPKGGILKVGVVGDGFNSFNPFIPKGSVGSGAGSAFESLTVPSGDEAFSRYGLLAEMMRMPEDRSWVSFRLREEARWQDGNPVTVEDVIWTFNTLKEQGSPFYRYYYRSVATAEKTGPRDVTFRFSGGENRELPLIMGDMTVLPKHYWEDRDFASTTLEPPMGSGPYRISDFEGNRFVMVERVEDYWGADLPVNRGMNNFDRIRYDYYPDSTIALEAFKAGEFDYRSENVAKNWALGYDIPAVHDGRIIKKDFPDTTAHGMQGFGFNLRRDQFKDKRVRQALAATFDFEWSNKTFAYDQYRHARSYFNASELEAKGLPKGRELEILDRFRDRLPPEIFTSEYNPPLVEGANGLRENLLWADGLLKQAGWVIDPDTLLRVNEETGRAFQLEFMIAQPTFQRWLLPIVRNMKRLGIEARIRIVDSSQYVERRRNRDFDMMVMGFGQSMSPGNEQRSLWGSDAADQPSSYNFTGIKDPVLDELVDLLIAAPTRADLVARTRALDRVLQWNHLVIPHIYSPTNRIAYWDKFGIPDKAPLRGYDIDTWWLDTARAERLKTGKAGG